LVPWQRQCTKVTVANCSFINNSANTIGRGALCFHNSVKIDIANSVFERNSVSAKSAQAKGGGAILVLAADASPVVYAFSGNHFTENMALSPGANALETATLVYSSVHVTNNRERATKAQPSVSRSLSCKISHWPLPTTCWPTRHQRQSTQAW
jgi:hypothetical protein